MVAIAVERRRAALVSDDAAGYSRLMAADELATIQTIKTVRRSHRSRPVIDVAMPWTSPGLGVRPGESSSGFAVPVAL